MIVFISYIVIHCNKLVDPLIRPLIPDEFNILFGTTYHTANPWALLQFTQYRNNPLFPTATALFKSYTYTWFIVKLVEFKPIIEVGNILNQLVPFMV
uniref:Uncharacterized protein n=1 Tax=viral metagenome TaxID=1070528 RepID=A0A6C0DQ64_9ZZZZ